MEPQLLDNILEQSLGQEEQARVNEALIIFREFDFEPEWKEPIYKEPTYTEPTFFKEFGLETGSMFLSVIGSTLISAFTVGLMLFISALNTDLTLIKGEDIPSWLDSLIKAAPLLFFIAGMFGFEGYAFSHGLAKGKASKEANFSNWALIAAFTVMISTGLLRSFGLFTNPDSLVLVVSGFIQWIVVLSTGVGAPVIVLEGTHNIGVFIGKFNAFKKSSKLEFDDALDKSLKDHETLRQNTYDSFLEERTKWGRRFTTWYKKNALSIFGVNRDTNPNTPQKREDTLGIQKAVKDYLDSLSITAFQVGIKSGDIISPLEIANKLELDPARVRTALSRLRNNK